jgi:hypothetical protein
MMLPPDGPWGSLVWIHWNCTVLHASPWAVLLIRWFLFHVSPSRRRSDVNSGMSFSNFALLEKVSVLGLFSGTPANSSTRCTLKWWEINDARGVVDESVLELSLSVNVRCNVSAYMLIRHVKEVKSRATYEPVRELHHSRHKWWMHNTSFACRWF